MDIVRRKLLLVTIGTERVNPLYNSYFPLSPREPLWRGRLHCMLRFKDVQIFLFYFYKPHSQEWIIVNQNQSQAQDYLRL